MSGVDSILALMSVKPHLVEKEEFQKVLNELIVSVKNHKYKAPRPNSSPRSDRLDVSPLIHALRRGMIESTQSVPVPSGVPFSKEIETPILLESPTSSSISIRLPPIPPSGNKSKRSRSSSVSRISITNKSDMALSSPGKLEMKDHIRLVRIVERIAARKILRAWTRFKKKRMRKSSDKQLKTLVKEMALGALSNAKLIREELALIRDEISHTPRSNVSLLSTPPPIRSTPSVSSLKSARLLMGPSVMSPSVMNKFLDYLTMNKGRDLTRLCVGQPSLHTKALVVVVLLDSLSVDDWLSHVVSCPFISAYDTAFPLSQMYLQGGPPWEIRVRSDMGTIVPVWRDTFPT
jgi:hypothetical protein